MSLFKVEAEKCNRDGICAAECPFKIIELKDKDSLPVPVEGAESICINCGHCVAVCPAGALTHAKISPEDCTPMNPEWKFSPEQTEHFLRQRRSQRTYKNKKVVRETLTRLIKMASYAPSGHNRQPVSWRIIYEKNEMESFTNHVADWMRFMIKEQPDFARSMHMDMVVGAWEAGVDVILRDAPHLIIAHGPKADPTVPAACTIAMTYLELAAPSLGLGGCWAGFFNAAAMFWPPLQKAMDLPEGHGCFGSFMIGEPKFKYRLMPPRNEPVISWA
ncbi:MAG: 4Fe-4S dicluster domain-containing protein [Deltaproteobacteria bacterium]|nr:4Fe-4S dicluster domain-containing protein [Deltaproteobacteria bacterium]